MTDEEFLYVTNNNFSNEDSVIVSRILALYNDKDYTPLEVYFKAKNILREFGKELKY